MLQLSDNDIKNGNLISQNKLDKDNLQWLKEFCPCDIKATSL